MKKILIFDVDFEIKDLKSKKLKMKIQTDSIYRRI